MAVIIQMPFFKCIFLNENLRFWSIISMKYDPYGPIDNKSALEQIIDWWLTVSSFTNME